MNNNLKFFILFSFLGTFSTNSVIKSFYATMADSTILIEGVHAFEGSMGDYNQEESSAELLFPGTWRIAVFSNVTEEIKMESDPIPHNAFAKIINQEAEIYLIGTFEQYRTI